MDADTARQYEALTMTALLTVVAILVGFPLAIAIVAAMTWFWLDLLIKGEFRGRRVWRGFSP